MEREQTKLLVRKVHTVYQHTFKFDDLTFMVDTWHEVLKDYDFERVNGNLKQYMLENEFPPKIKDLVAGLVVNEKYNIPGIEETKKIIEGYQVPKEQRITQEERKELIKSVLGEGWLKE